MGCTPSKLQNNDSKIDQQKKQKTPSEKSVTKNPNNPNNQSEQNQPNIDDQSEKKQNEGKQFYEMMKEQRRIDMEKKRKLYEENQSENQEPKKEQSKVIPPEQFINSSILIDVPSIIQKSQEQKEENKSKEQNKEQSEENKYPNPYTSTARIQLNKHSAVDVDLISESNFTYHNPYVSTPFAESRKVCQLQLRDTQQKEKSIITERKFQYQLPISGS